MIDIAGYQCFRKDRFKYLAFNVILSPTMNFNIVLYNPPSHNTSFYDELSLVAKQLDSYKETVWYGGDFNINWSDKSSKQKFKTIMTKLNYLQMIKGPTRITRQTKTLIDMAFTNKPERSLHC